VCADPAPIFTRLREIVGADGDQPAIGDFEFTMELNEKFRLAPVLGAETSAAENQNHGMRSLQFEEPATFCGVVGELVVGKGDPWNNIGSHRCKSSNVG
jgi:hypothetical protein